MTVSVVIPRKIGRLFMIILTLKIVMQCCLTCLVNVISPAEEIEKRFIAPDMKGLVLVRRSYMQIMEHLIIMQIADQ